MKSPYICKEWIEKVNNEETLVDNHDWIEIEKDVLKCRVCGKLSK